MLTFTKDGGTKLVSEDSKDFIKLIIDAGWKETKKKGVKNATDSTDSN